MTYRSIITGSSGIFFVPEQQIQKPAAAANSKNVTYFFIYPPDKIKAKIRVVRKLQFQNNFL